MDGILLLIFNDLGNPQTILEQVREKAAPKVFTKRCIKCAFHGQQAHDRFKALLKIVGYRLPARYLTPVFQENAAVSALFP